MSFSDIDTGMGSDLMDIFGDPAVYRRCNGETISTRAEIDFNVEVFDESGSGVVENRTVALLPKADIGEPKRGDVIIMDDGTNYTVHDWLQDMSDNIDIRVSVK